MQLVHQSFSVFPVDKETCRVQIIVNDKPYSHSFTRAQTLLLFSNNPTVGAYSKSLIAEMIIKANGLYPVFRWLA